MKKSKTIRKIKNLVKKYEKNLKVFQSSLLEYKRYLKMYEGNPYALYLENIRKRKKKINLRWKKLLKEYDLICRLFFEVASILSIIRYLPLHENQLQPFNDWIEQKKVKLCLEIERAYKNVKIVHKTICTFTNILINLTKPSPNNSNEYTRFKKAMGRRIQTHIYVKPPETIVSKKQINELITEMKIMVSKLNEKFYYEMNQIKKEHNNIFKVNTQIDANQSSNKEYEDDLKEYISPSFPSQTVESNRFLEHKNEFLKKELFWNPSEFKNEVKGLYLKSDSKIKQEKNQRKRLRENYENSLRIPKNY